jgi:hypothetical protein
MTKFKVLFNYGIMIVSKTYYYPITDDKTLRNPSTPYAFTNTPEGEKSIKIYNIAIGEKYENKPKR